MCILYDMKGAAFVEKMTEEMAKVGFTPYSFLAFYERMTEFPWSRVQTSQDVADRSRLIESLTKPHGAPD